MAFESADASHLASDDSAHSPLRSGHSWKRDVDKERRENLLLFERELQKCLEKQKAKNAKSNARGNQRASSASNLDNTPIIPRIPEQSISQPVTPGVAFFPGQAVSASHIGSRRKSSNGQQAEQTRGLPLTELTSFPRWSQWLPTIDLQNTIKQAGAGICFGVLWLLTHPRVLISLVVCWQFFLLLQWISPPFLPIFTAIRYLGTGFVNASVTYGSSMFAVGSGSVRFAATTATSYACSYAALQGLCTVQTLSLYRATSIPKLAQAAASNFAQTTEENAALRSITWSLIICENEVEALELTLKVAKFNSPLIESAEDCSFRVPAFSNSLGDFLSSNAASVDIMLTMTRTLRDRMVISKIESPCAGVSGTTSSADPMSVSALTLG